APRQGHAEQLVEDQMNHHGEKHRERSREQRPHAQREEKRKQNDRAADEKTELVGGENVERERTGRDEKVEQVPRRAEPRAHLDERLAAAIAPAAPDERDRAAREQDGDEPREGARTDALARDLRIALDSDEDRDRQREEH